MLCAEGTERRQSQEASVLLQRVLPIHKRGQGRMGWRHPRHDDKRVATKGPAKKNHAPNSRRHWNGRSHQNQTGEKTVPSQLGQCMVPQEKERTYPIPEILAFQVLWRTSCKQWKVVQNWEIEWSQMWPLWTRGHKNTHLQMRFQQRGSWRFPSSSRDSLRQSSVWGRFGDMWPQLSSRSTAARPFPDGRSRQAWCLMQDEIFMVVIRKLLYWW